MAARAQAFRLLFFLCLSQHCCWHAAAQAIDDYYLDDYSYYEDYSDYPGPQSGKWRHGNRSQGWIEDRLGSSSSCGNGEETEDHFFTFQATVYFLFAGSNQPSVPSSSSALSHQALIGQLVTAQSHQLNHQKGKLLPEPGWIPLTDTPVGKSPNPAITFLQGAVTPAHTALSEQQPVFRSRPDQQQQQAFAQQKPTHKPVIVVQQRPV